MCVDLSHLNHFVIREKHQSLTPAQAIADIAASDAKYFTVIDALKGYHQCPLDQQSQPLTTFITPVERFTVSIFVLLLASAQYQSTITAR